MQNEPFDGMFAISVICQNFAVGDLPTVESATDEDFVLKRSKGLIETFELATDTYPNLMPITEDVSLRLLRFLNPQRFLLAGAPEEWDEYEEAIQHAIRRCSKSQFQLPPRIVAHTLAPNIPYSRLWLSHRRHRLALPEYESDLRFVRRVWAERGLINVPSTVD